MWEEQKNSIRSLIIVNEDLHSMLHEYQKKLKEWMAKHQDLRLNLKNMVEQSDKALRLLDQEDSKVTVRLSEGKRERKRLENMLANLKPTSTIQEVMVGIDNAELFHQLCCEEFPDVYTFHTVVQVWCSFL